MALNVRDFAKSCFLKYGREAIRDTHENIKSAMIDMQRSAENTLSAHDKQEKNNEMDER